MSEVALTHKDLAVLLGVSETTIKSYRRKFPGSIPVFSKGKPIRFKPEAAEICLRIRDLFSTGMSVEEVGTRLGENFGWRKPKAAEAEARQPRKAAGVDLSQSFATALGNMAKSMISLNQSQAGMLASIKRLEGSLGEQQELFGSLGEAVRSSNLDPGELLEAGRRNDSAVKTMTAVEDTLSKYAGRFDELLESLKLSQEEGRLLRQEQMKENYAILQVLQQIEEQLRTLQTVGQEQQASKQPDGFGAPAAENGSPVLVRSGKISPRVIQFQQPGQGGGADPVADQAGTGVKSAAVGSAVSGLQGMILLEPAEVPRHLLHLPLLIRLDDGSYMSAGGKSLGRAVSINDVKAMLANAFMPPENFTLHWEQGAEGFWVVFEQTGLAGSGMHLRCQVWETTSNKGVGILEIRKYLENNKAAHPVEFCRFLSGITK